MQRLDGSSPAGREDLGAVLEVEVVDFLGGKQRTTVLVRRREHGCHQPAGARPGDHIEVVREPRVWPVELLQCHKNPWLDLELAGASSEIDAGSLVLHACTCTCMPASHAYATCMNNPDLQLFLEEAEDGAWDDPAHAAAVDAQHGDDAPVGRWRRLGRAQRRGAAAERPLRNRVERQAGAGGGPVGAELPSIHWRHG